MVAPSIDKHGDIMRDQPQWKCAAYYRGRNGILVSVVGVVVVIIVAAAVVEVRRRLFTVLFVHRVLHDLELTSGGSTPHDIVQPNSDKMAEIMPVAQYGGYHGSLM